ncbi:hypothetical protein EV356DRAFT_576327 [Viridothelium virens]|uniref:C2H2-type domain-containing protein n=1 Tax=Viridothelium virens TaxID=1048519 RepID=A0A6A6HA48_VIRVR|nr:hypothetical protein EV356DRAFT_576327 [Viridothelium virens]
MRFDEASNLSKHKKSKHGPKTYKCRHPGCTHEDPRWDNFMRHLEKSVKREPHMPELLKDKNALEAFKRECEEIARRETEMEEDDAEAQNAAVDPSFPAPGTVCPYASMGTVDGGLPNLDAFFGNPEPSNAPQNPPEVSHEDQVAIENFVYNSFDHQGAPQSNPGDSVGFQWQHPQSLPPDNSYVPQNGTVDSFANPGEPQWNLGNSFQSQFPAGAQQFTFVSVAPQHGIITASANPGGPQSNSGASPTPQYFSGVVDPTLTGLTPGDGTVFSSANQGDPQWISGSSSQPQFSSVAPELTPGAFAAQHGLGVSSVNPGAPQWNFSIEPQVFSGYNQVSAQNIAGNSAEAQNGTDDSFANPGVPQGNFDGPFESQEVLLDPDDIAYLDNLDFPDLGPLDGQVMGSPWPTPSNDTDYDGDS